MSQLCGM